jgi:hypothetical protein
MKWTELGQNSDMCLALVNVVMTVWVLFSIAQFYSESETLQEAGETILQIFFRRLSNRNAPHNEFRSTTARINDGGPISL